MSVPKSTPTGFLAMLLLAALAALVSACEPLPPLGSQDSGFVELDENTEPRFVRLDRAGPIGTLRVDGNNVYVNGARVTHSVRLPNSAFVSTGPGSGARIDFEGDTGYQCRIGIQDFRLGRLYAETQRCLHQVTTPQGVGQARSTQTVYHASVFQQQTVLTVIRGVMRAWLWQQGSRAVVVGPLQEVVLTPSTLIGPRPVSESYVRQLTAWRNKFDFSYKPPEISIDFGGFRRGIPRETGRDMPRGTGGDGSTSGAPTTGGGGNAGSTTGTIDYGGVGTSGQSTQPPLH